MTLLTLLALTVPSSFAYSSGKTGSSTTGCTCHGAAAPDTSVSFSASTTTVAPGDTLAVQFLVDNASQTSAGLNVTVSDGALAAGANTQLSSSEITHNSPQTLPAAFEMTWTAPSTPGIYTFYGSGNAVNLSGSTAGDQWNQTTWDVTVAESSCSTADDDTDGYSECDGDCVDTNAGIRPGVADNCDGVDTDCDGAVDDDAVYEERYTDADGDSYGDPATGVNTCEQPTGTTTDSTDCDDNNVAVFPGAPEIWYDGTDQNCDGNDDDQDGDGVAYGEDCDDLDATINTGCDSDSVTDDTGPVTDDTGPVTDDTGPDTQPEDDTGPPSDDTSPPAGDTGAKESPPPDGTGVKGGCGCSTTSPMSALLPLLLAVVAGRRRRSI